MLNDNNRCMAICLIFNTLATYGYSYSKSSSKLWSLVRGI